MASSMFCVSFFCYSIILTYLYEIIINKLLYLFVGVLSALDHFQMEHFMNLKAASIVNMIFMFSLLHAVENVVCIVIY